MKSRKKERPMKNHQFSFCENPHRRTGFSSESPVVLRDLPRLRLDHLVEHDAPRDGAVFLRFVAYHHGRLEDLAMGRRNRGPRGWAVML